jgi:hypothetical protein
MRLALLLLVSLAPLIGFGQQYDNLYDADQNYDFWDDTGFYELGTTGNKRKSLRLVQNGPQSTPSTYGFIKENGDVYGCDSGSDMFTETPAYFIVAAGSEMYADPSGLFDIPEPDPEPTGDNSDVVAALEAQNAYLEEIQELIYKGINYILGILFAIPVCLGMERFFR